MMLALALIGCGGGNSHEAPKAEPAPAPAVEAPAPPPPAPPAAPLPARTFFVAPANGATVKSPVHLSFGVEGMEVRPAGDATPNSGHHHVIVTPIGEPGVVPAGTQVPKDETHVHYGKGQTEADLELKPGKYRLTLQFADTNHVSFGDPMASTVEITVE